jgi:hypothetical protein
MEDSLDQKKWAQLKRLTRRHGFFWGIPMIKPNQEMTIITENPIPHFVLLLCVFPALAMAGLTLLAPWIAHYSDAWLAYLKTNEKIHKYIVLLIALTGICGYDAFVKLLQKRKIIINSTRNELELHYGSYLFPKCLILRKGQFEPQIQTEREFLFFKYKALVLCQFIHPNQFIKLFGISRQQGLAGYEKVMTFIHGNLPDHLAATIPLSHGGTITFSKAPLFQRGPLAHSLQYSSTTLNRIVFQRLHSDLISLLMIGLITLGINIFFFINLGFSAVLEMPFTWFFFLYLLSIVLDRKLGISFREVIIDKSINKVLLAPSRWTGNKESQYSFDDIAALQICLRRRKAKLDDHPSVLELNLVLATKDNQRFTLGIANETPAVRKRIQALAEFMEKPLIDHTDFTLDYSETAKVSV